MSLRIIASFWLLLWCSFLLPLSASQVDAHEKNKTPCQIDVGFEDDTDGVAPYVVVRLQYKKQRRRNIEAIITGKMSNKVGYDTWVKMIEDQRQQIGIASRCEVLGVRYKK